MLLFGINSCSKQTGCLVIVIFDTSIQNIGNASITLNCFMYFNLENLHFIVVYKL